jgi:hypothetical protein
VDVRLVQLLTSFIAARSEYALLRLEFALEHPKLPAPPVIESLPDASEETLRTAWPRLEDRLDAALGYVKRWARDDGSTGGSDDGFGALERRLHEMEQYARAVRWVLTVTESEQR